MIYYTTTTTEQELHDILALQTRNLMQSVSKQEAKAQGFVTVQHTYDLLKKLHDTEPHIIAKEHDVVVGYILSMTQKARFDIPVLIPMFEVFDEIQYRGKTISESEYIVVGQVCVDKNFRGQGIFDRCYTAYKDFHQRKYDFVITEIAATNHRSRKAHKRRGFEEIHSYFDGENTEWIVVVWDWHEPNARDNTENF